MPGSKYECHPQLLPTVVASTCQRILWLFLQIQQLKLYCGFRLPLMAATACWGITQALNNPTQKRWAIDRSSRLVASLHKHTVTCSSTGIAQQYFVYCRVSLGWKLSRMKEGGSSHLATHQIFQNANIRRMPIYKQINVKYQETQLTKVMTTGCRYVMQISITCFKNCNVEPTLTGSNVKNVAKTWTLVQTFNQTSRFENSLNDMAETEGICQH